MSIVTLKLSDIISKQATINIGTIGHVSNGKSTLVRNLTTVVTQKHKEELEKNITTHLGYANAKIFMDLTTGDIQFKPSDTTEVENPKNGNKMTLVKHISFVDCPGHESFMATMISGSNIMDASILIEAANSNTIPLPQTYEHLMIMDLIKIPKILVAQNKVDLVENKDIKKNRDKIVDFIEDTVAEDAPIFPISAQSGLNVDKLGEYIVKEWKEVSRTLNEPVRMNIVRSFDINRSNTKYQDLTGGVIGGTIIQGVLKVGDLLEILPGIPRNEKGKTKYQPIITKVVSLHSEKNSLDLAIPGGLIGVGTTLDPSFCKGDALVGQVCGHLGTMESLVNELEVEVTNIKRHGDTKVISYTLNEKVKICINGDTIFSTITKIKENKKLGKQIVTVKLGKPICLINTETLAIMKNQMGTYKLGSMGKIIDKKPIDKDQVDYSDEYLEIISEQELSETEYIIEDDINLSGGFEYNYDDLVANCDRKLKIININLEIPILTQVNRQTKWDNYSETKDDLLVYQEEQKEQMERILYDFVLGELSTTGSLNGESQLMLNGKFKATQIQSILTSFSQKYLMCPVCKSSYTTIKKTNVLQRNCKTCGAYNTVI